MKAIWFSLMELKRICLIECSLLFNETEWLSEKIWTTDYIIIAWLQNTWNIAQEPYWQLLFRFLSFFFFLALLSLWWTFFKISHFVAQKKSILVNKDKTIIVGWTVHKVLYIFYGSYSGTFYYYLKIFCKHRRSGHVSLWQRLHSSGPFTKYLIFEIRENWA